MNLKRILQIAIFFVAFSLPLFVSNSYIISIFCVTLIYGLAASGWNIISGICGQVGFGNSLFYALGAYVTASSFAYYHVNPWLAMIFGAVLVGIISILLGFITFPLSGTYYSLATVALLEILRLLFYDSDYILGIRVGGGAGINIPWIGGFKYMQFVDKRYYYYILLISLVIVLISTNKLVRHKIGFYFRAISTNELAASTMGINVLKYKCIAQFMSAFIMSCCGSIYVMYTMYIEPNGMFSFDTALYMLLIAVIGGLGTVYGPILGALLLMPLYEVIRSNFSGKLPGIAAVIFGLLLMICMQFFPEGIIPTGKLLLAKRKTAKKHEESAVAKDGE